MSRSYMCAFPVGDSNQFVNTKFSKPIIKKLKLFFQLFVEVDIDPEVASPLITDSPDGGKSPLQLDIAKVGKEYSVQNLLVAYISGLL